MTLQFDDDVRAELEAAMIESKQNAAPNEMCGVVVRNDHGIYFIETTNAHDDPKNHFKIRAQDLAHIEETTNEILAIAHSHPDGNAQLSMSDRQSSHLHNKPFVIVSHDDQVIWHEVPEPLPLIGRDYEPVVADCYTIAQDFYFREYGITLPDFDRHDRWWENADHKSLYMEGFEKAGFVVISKEEIRRGDALLMRLGDTEHVNHAIIYLGDDGTLKSEDTPPCIGKTLYLHHPYGRKSVRKILGPEMFSRCEVALRHRSLL